MPPAGRASWIHVDDLAALLTALIPSSEYVTGKTFEPDDGAADGWSHRELALAIGAAVGRKPWVPHLSKTVLEFAAKADGFLRRSDAKLTPDRVGYMTHPDWVVSKSYKVPGRIWRAKVPSDEGLKSTAEWYRKEGWL